MSGDSDCSGAGALPLPESSSGWPGFLASAETACSKFRSGRSCTWYAAAWEIGCHSRRGDPTTVSPSRGATASGRWRVSVKLRGALQVWPVPVASIACTRQLHVPSTRGKLSLRAFGLVPIPWMMLLRVPAEPKRPSPVISNLYLATPGTSCQLTIGGSWTSPSCDWAVTIRTCFLTLARGTASSSAKSPGAVDVVPVPGTTRYQ
jgi:hypothetical protein